MPGISENFKTTLISLYNRYTLLKKNCAGITFQNYRNCMVYSSEINFKIIAIYHFKNF